MSRDTCLKRILEKAKSATVKPALVMPDNGCRPNKATLALVEKCRIQPKFDPNQIIDPLKNRSLSGDQVDELRYAVEHLLSVNATKANRNDAAWLIAVECRKALYEHDEALAMVREWNHENTPPLEDSEVRMVIRSAYAGKAYDTGTKAYPELKKAREVAKKKLKKKKRVKPRKAHEEKEPDPEEPAEEESPKKKKRKTEKKKIQEIYPRPLIGLGDILYDKTIREKPDPVGRWISFRKKTTLLGAREKGGKTTFSFYDSLYAMLKRELKVMYVLGHTENQQEEMKIMSMEAGLVGLDRKKLNAMFRLSVGTALPSSWNELFDQIDEFHPDMLVLDTLTSVLNACHDVDAPDTSEAEKWEAIMSPITQITEEMDMGTIIVHHTTKANMEEFRGSTGIAASATYCTLITYKSRMSMDRRVVSYGRAGCPIPREMYLTYVGGKEGFHETEKSSVEKVDTATNAVKEAIGKILISGKKVERGRVYDLLENKYGISCSRTTIRRAKDDLGVEIIREGNKYFWHIPIGMKFGKGKVDD